MLGQGKYETHLSFSFFIVYLNVAVHFDILRKTYLYYITKVYHDVFGGVLYIAVKSYIVLYIKSLIFCIVYRISYDIVFKKIIKKLIDTLSFYKIS